MDRRVDAFAVELDLGLQLVRIVVVRKQDLDLVLRRDGNGLGAGGVVDLHLIDRVQRRHQRQVGIVVKAIVKQARALREVLHQKIAAVEHRRGRAADDAEQIQPVARGLRDDAAPGLARIAGLDAVRPGVV